MLSIIIRCGSDPGQNMCPLRPHVGCRNWFYKFRSGDFSLKYEQRLGRPNDVDDDQIKAIIESDRHVTVGEIEEILKIPKSVIDRHIQRLGPLVLCILNAMNSILF